MSHWLDKLWMGNQVFEESICFTDSNLNSSSTLCYPPKKVLKVTSSDRSIEYDLGKDYLVQGNQLIRTAESRIPVLERKLYYMPYEQDQNTNWLRTIEGSHYIKIFPNLREYQVLVSYEHNSKWTGTLPQDQRNMLPISTKLLENQQPITLVFYGDSITAGFEASGCDEHVIDMYTLKEYHLKIEHAPYLPSWASLVTNSLAKHYHHPQIKKINRGAAGSSSAWGVTNVDQFVTSHHPDLVILAFGMNNLNDEPSKYYEEITSIISSIRNANPQCEFLLVSPMEANREIGWLSNHKLLQHEQILYRIQEEYTGIGVAPVHSVFVDILNTGKKYMDISGNLINHPNDFSTRIYAQTILSCLGISNE